jgi:heterodisulfide reductase subunit C2
MADIDAEKRNRMVAEIPDLLKCYQCGTCVSSCPAKIYSGHFSPRELILRSLRGMQEGNLNDDLWRCITCNNCNERCPQDVNPYEVVVKLKNIALREGLVSKERTESMTASFNRLIDTGLAYPNTELSAKRRKELGLSELKEIDLSKVAKKR